MSAYTPYIIAGIVTGGVYGIAALGLVMTYRSSKVFNFAHGATAYFVAIVYYKLRVGLDWPIVPAAVVALLVLAPLMGLVLWALLFRHLEGVSPTIRLVATIGLYVALPALADVLFGTKPVFSPPGLAPEPVHIFHVLGTGLDTNQLAVVAAAVAVAVVVPLMLRWTRFGLAIRATVDRPGLAALRGTDTRVVSAVSWTIGSTLAGLAGVLLAPLAGLDVGYFTLLLIASFAAAAVGALWSLPLTFAGAIVIGLVESLSTKLAGSNQLLSAGLGPSIPFAVLVIALVVNHRRGTFAQQDIRTDELTAVTRDVTARRSSLWPGALTAAAIVIILTIVLHGVWIATLATGGAFAIVFLSFVPIAGWGGMISLCQATLVAVGGITAGKLATVYGVDPLLAVIAGGAVAGIVAVVFTLPVLRLSGIYFALATISFGLFFDELIFPAHSLALGNHGQLGQSMPPLDIAGVRLNGDRGFFLLTMVLFGLVAVLMHVFRRSGTGLSLVAIRCSEPGALASGVSVASTKAIVFGFSGALAGVGGALLASYQGQMSAGNFPVLSGVVWFAVFAIYGVESATGALIAGLSFALIPQLFTTYLPARVGEVPTIMFGLGAIGLARNPDGVVAQVGDGLRMLVSAGRRRAVPVTVAPGVGVAGDPLVMEDVLGEG